MKLEDIKVNEPINISDDQEKITDNILEVNTFCFSCHNPTATVLGTDGLARCQTCCDKKPVRQGQIATPFLREVILTVFVWVFALIGLASTIYWIARLMFF